MARVLSLVRRRANLVDPTLQPVSGVATYKFNWLPNFDSGSPTLFDTVPVPGKQSATVQDVKYPEQFKNLTRFLFNPADYSIPDTQPFWLQVQPVNTDGSLGTLQAMHLILPYSSQPHRAVNLHGGVPSGATIANSLELQLPMQCWDLQMQVDGTADLYMAFHSGGYEYRVPSLQNQFTNYSAAYPSFSQLFLRGNGGATTISASMALRNNSWP